MIEAHHLFGFPYEQHRRRRPPGVDRARARPPQRRRVARAPRATRTCACRSRTRSTIPERADVPVPSARPRARSAASTFEPPDLETFRCLALARDAAIAGGTAPCVLNAANEVAVHAFLGGRLALPRHRAGDRGRARGERAAAGAQLRRPLRRRRARRARTAAALVERLAVRRALVSWFLAFARLRGADHPARVRATSSRRRRSACASSGSRSSSRPIARQGAARRDRVRHRRDPARRLREDHRDEPGGGAASGRRAARLLPPAGVEADRRDRRRARREPPDRVPDPVRPRVRRRASSTSSVAEITPGSPAARVAAAGRPDHLGRRRARRPGRRFARQISSHQCAGQPAARLPRRARPPCCGSSATGSVADRARAARATTPSRGAR